MGKLAPILFHSIDIITFQKTNHYKKIVVFHLREPFPIGHHGDSLGELEEGARGGMVAVDKHAPPLSPDDDCLEPP